MKQSPSNRPESESKTYRGVLKALIAATALGSNTLGCASAQTLPSSHVSDVSANSILATQKTEKEVVRPTTPEIPNNAQVINITIMGKASRPWPDAPTICVYTGNVLIYDQYSEPHTIILENMCRQERMGIANIFEGAHKQVNADSKGHYEIPFHDSHLEEKDGHLFFVTEQNGNRVEEGLCRGSEPGTLTFEYSLDNHNIRPIVTN